jgi:hypothetical protein
LTGPPADLPEDESAKLRHPRFPCLRRKSEQRVTRDKDGKICIVHAREPFSRYLSIAFDAISEAAGPDRIALPELRNVIEKLEALADSQGQRSALRRYKSKLKSSKEDKPDK